MLMSIYEQGKQVCEVRVDKFGDLDQDAPARLPNKHEVVKLAGEFMAELCTDHCRKMFPVEDFHKQRDLKLEGKGKGKGSKKKQSSTTEKPATKKAKIEDQQTEVDAEAKKIASKTEIPKKNAPGKSSTHDEKREIWRNKSR